jgi:predicted nucleotidyltransferase
MVDKTTNIKLKILSLFRSDYLANFYIREMAELIKKNHVTILPHLKSMEKDNILISRVAGKNKIYSLNLDNILAKNYICMSELSESVFFQEKIFIIKKINEEISKLYLSGSFLLFGSYAKNSFKDDSDIDIFYLGRLKEAELIKIKAIGKVYDKIINIKTAEIKNFEAGLRKKDALIMEILKYHIVLQNFDLFINALWKYYNEIRR